ncbi:MAG: KUP/HAK/KT family potassium transporter, partial [Stellaceae bacterium]
MPDTAVVHAHAHGKLGQSLGVAALGVVYGDIGTSPLYTVKQCFVNASVSEARVFGVLSLIAWALMLVVTAKYVLVLMRADNRGEGGILALMALAQRVCVTPKMRAAVALIGIAGAC